MSARSPLNRRRELIWRVAGAITGVVGALYAPLAGRCFFQGDARAGVLSCMVCGAGFFLSACCWLLWTAPEAIFRMAIPPLAGKGGCSKCAARFLTTKFDDDGTQAGLIVWHEVGCIDGARVEQRTVVAE